MTSINSKCAAYLKASFDFSNTVTEGWGGSTMGDDTKLMDAFNLHRYLDDDDRYYCRLVKSARTDEHVSETNPAYVGWSRWE